MSSSRVKSAVFGAGRWRASSRTTGGLAVALLTRMEGEDHVEPNHVWLAEASWRGGNLSYFYALVIPRISSAKSTFGARLGGQRSRQERMEAPCLALPVVGNPTVV